MIFASGNCVQNRQPISNQRTTFAGSTRSACNSDTGHADEFGTLEKGKLADVLIVEGDVIADISLLENRTKFIAVMQGGVIKAGQLAKSFPTVVKRER
ncbi:MAG: hypothetical protein WCI02_17635 [Planctomycetota bacterium]|jgi:predicted amidohydrolase YtcJ